MIKLKLKSGKNSGFIKYSTDNLSDFNIKFSDSDIKEDIENYLRSHREFRILRSKTIDDFAIKFARPIDSLEYFELALSSLYGEFDIWVEW